MNEMIAINSAGKNRLVLLVEDTPLQANGIKSIVETTGVWKVEICHSSEEALSLLNQRFQERRNIPDIVSIDLGLPPLEEDTQIGLALLKEIKSRWKMIKLVVHTSLTGVIDERVVHDILSEGASFIFLRDQKETTSFSNLLTFIAEGYVICSPKPAFVLPNIISKKPDPLGGKKNLWQTLELLGQENKTYEEIADVLFLEPRSIMNRVKQIATLIGEDEINLLSDASDIDNERYKKKVVRWWRQNHHKYGH